MSKTTTTTKGNTMTTTYTSTELAPVTIGATIYRVERQTNSNNAETIWFYGRATSRGTSVFMLQPFSNDSTSAVLISWTTGSAMTSKGNRVILTVIGDIIEVQ